MERRGFLLGILAACVAPAIIRPDRLMKPWVPPVIWTPYHPSIACITEDHLVDSLAYAIQPWLQQRAQQASRLHRAAFGAEILEPFEFQQQGKIITVRGRIKVG